MHGLTLQYRPSCVDDFNSKPSKQVGLNISYDYKWKRYINLYNKFFYRSKTKIHFVVVEMFTLLS